MIFALFFLKQSILKQKQKGGLSIKTLPSESGEIRMLQKAQSKSGF